MPQHKLRCCLVPCCISASAVQEDNVISNVKQGKNSPDDNASKVSKADAQKTGSPAKNDVRDTMEAQHTAGARFESKLSSDDLKAIETVQHVANGSSSKACTLDKNFGSEVHPVVPSFAKSPRRQRKMSPAKSVNIPVPIEKMANDLVYTVIRTAIVELLTTTSIKDSLDNILSNFESDKDAVVEISGIELDVNDPSDEERSHISSAESVCDGEDNVVTQVVSEVIESSKTTPSLETLPLDAPDIVADMEVQISEKTPLSVHTLNDGAVPSEINADLPVSSLRTSSVNASSTGADIEIPPLGKVSLSNSLLDDSDLSTLNCTTEKSVAQGSEMTPVNAPDVIPTIESSSQHKAALPLRIHDDGDLSIESLERNTNLGTSSSLQADESTQQQKGQPVYSNDHSDEQGVNSKSSDSTQEVEDEKSVEQTVVQDNSQS